MVDWTQFWTALVIVVGLLIAIVLLYAWG